MLCSSLYAAVWTLAWSKHKIFKIKSILQTTYTPVSFIKNVDLNIVDMEDGSIMKMIYESPWSRYDYVWITTKGSLLEVHIKPTWLIEIDNIHKLCIKVFGTGTFKQLPFVILDISPHVSCNTMNEKSIVLECYPKVQE